MIFHLKEICGTRCMLQDKGQNLYEKIHPLLKRGDELTLDFEGVTQFASPFFNFAIGQLLKDLSVEHITQNLRIVNINSAGRDVIERVIENASEYYGSEYKRGIINSILEKRAEESR